MRGQAKRRRLNVKLVVIAALILAGLIGAGTIGFFHFRTAPPKTVEQALGNADEYLADRTLQDDLDQIRRYVIEPPAGEEGRRRLDELLHERLVRPGSDRVTEWEPGSRPIQWSKVYLTYEKAIQQDPDRDDIRRDLVVLGLASGRVADARRHLKHLLASSPNEPELNYLLGVCEENTHDYDAAARHYGAAIDLGYREIAAFVRLTKVLQRLNRPFEAEAAVDRMVAVNPDNYSAYLQRAVFRASTGKPQQALADALQARELAPDEPAVLLQAARMFLEQPERDESHAEQARKLLKRGIARHPDDARFYEALAHCEIDQGNLQQAAAVLAQGQSRLPEAPMLACLSADLMISQGDLEGAERELRRLVGHGSSVSSVEMMRTYLTARLTLARGEPLAARKLLESVSPNPDEPRWLIEHVRLLRAECCRTMGDLDNELTEYRQLLRERPVSLRGRLGLASALKRMGRREEALWTYRSLLPHPQAAAETVRIVLENNRRLPPEERDWEMVDSVLAQLPERAAGSLALSLLSAEARFARGQHEQAAELLASARQEHPERIEPWLLSARLAMIQRDWDRARQLLDEAEQQAGEKPSLRLARALLFALSGDNGAGRLDDLGKNLDGFSSLERTRLLEGLAFFHNMAGRGESAVRLWLQVAEENPQHLPAQFRAFRLLLQRSDAEAAERMLARLSELDGDQGRFVSCAKAIQLMEQAQQGDAQSLARARRILETITGNFPEWPPAALYLGRLNLLQRRTAEAADNYHRAIRMGVRDPAAVRQTFRLLISAGRYADAEQVVELLRRDPLAFPSRQLDKFAAEIALKDLEFQQAISLGRRVVERADGDSLDRLWLAQLLASSGREQEAEDAIRQALARNPESEAAHVALVQLLARRGRRRSALQAVSAAEQRLSAEKSAVALALCHAMVGHKRQAEQYFLRAAEAEPDSGKVLASTAGFYLRIGEPKKAERLLRRLLSQETGSADNWRTWARRSLAALIASRGHRAFREAVSLLEKNIEESADARRDELAKAGLLAGSAHKRYLRQARELFASLEGELPLPPREQLLFAQTLDRLGEHAAADTRWNSLLRRESVHPKYRAHHVNRLLLLGRLREASRHLEVLSTLAPGEYETIELKARLRTRRGDADGAIALIDSYCDSEESASRRREPAGDNPEADASGSPGEADASGSPGEADASGSPALPKAAGGVAGVERSEPPAQGAATPHPARSQPPGSAQRLRKAADLLERLSRLPADAEDVAKLRKEAERRFRLLLPGDREARLSLVENLARQGRLDEALALCREALETEQDEPWRLAEAAFLAARIAGADGSALKRVEQWLQRVAEENPGSAEALVRLADFRMFQNDFDSAAALYRRAHELDKDNVVALNNLAWLQSVRNEKHDQALALIEAALEIAGPDAALLDTRGLIRLALGDHEGALTDFQEAIDQADLPDKRFHAALACWRMNLHDEAVDHLRRAERLGLAEATLPLPERASYAALKDALGRDNER